MSDSDIGPRLEHEAQRAAINSYYQPETTTTGWGQLSQFISGAGIESVRVQKNVTKLNIGCQQFLIYRNEADRVVIEGNIGATNLSDSELAKIITALRGV